MNSRLAVLSYYNVSGSFSGGMRRINELLQAIGPERVDLFQPGREHPLARTVGFKPDFGRHRVGINWGIFNFFWPPTASRVRQRVSSLEPSCLVLTSIWAWAPFARHPMGIPMVLDAQNVDAVAIAERFGSGHPYTRLVASWERRVVLAAERIMVCSEVDREGLIQAYGVAPGRVHVVPNGAALPPDPVKAGPPLDPALESRLGNATVCLFVGGKLDYPPNAEGLRFMTASLMPALKRLTPAPYRILVVGAPVPRTCPHPDVIHVGRVPSLDPYLRRADICLAPIFSGSGTRLKVLDYLAWGKPLVATPKAVEGISCQDGVHALLADHAAFARAVERMRQDPALARECGANGRELVRQCYEWGAVRSRWQEALKPWLQE